MTNVYIPKVAVDRTDAQLYSLWAKKVYFAAWRQRAPALCKGSKPQVWCVIIVFLCWPGLPISQVTTMMCGISPHPREDATLLATPACCYHKAFSLPLAPVPASLQSYTVWSLLQWDWLFPSVTVSFPSHFLLQLLFLNSHWPTISLLSLPTNPVIFLSHSHSSLNTWSNPNT